MIVAHLSVRGVELFRESTMKLRRTEADFRLVASSSSFLSRMIVLPLHGFLSYLVYHMDSVELPFS